MDHVLRVKGAQGRELVLDSLWCGVLWGNGCFERTRFKMADGQFKKKREKTDIARKSGLSTWLSWSVPFALRVWGASETLPLQRWLFDLWWETHLYCNRNSWSFKCSFPGELSLQHEQAFSNQAFTGFPTGTRIKSTERFATSCWTLLLVCR